MVSAVVAEVFSVSTILSCSVFEVRWNPVSAKSVVGCDVYLVHFSFLVLAHFCDYGLSVSFNGSSMTAGCLGNFVGDRY